MSFGPACRSELGVTCGSTRRPQGSSGSRIIDAPQGHMCPLESDTDRVTKPCVSSICADEEAEALSSKGLPRFRLGEKAKLRMGSARKKGLGRGTVLGFLG